MINFQGFTSPRCFAFYLKKNQKQFSNKNYEFSALNFRKEIVPDKLKLPLMENCLFSPNLSTKSVLQRFYVVVLRNTEIKG